MKTQTDGRIRKKVLIDVGFQIRFGLALFIGMLVIATVAIWTTYVSTFDVLTQQLTAPKLHQQLQRLYAQQAEDGVKKTQQQVSALVTMTFTEIFDRVAGQLAGRLVLVMMIMFGVSMVAAHKIAGPLYRLKKAAQQIETGDLTVDLRFLREGDELKELALATHAAITSVRMAVQRIQHGAEQLRGCAAACVADTQPDQLPLEQRQLRAISEQLSRDVAFFKTMPPAGDPAAGKIA